MASPNQVLDMTPIGMKITKLQTGAYTVGKSPGLLCNRNKEFIIELGVKWYLGMLMNKYRRDILAKHLLMLLPGYVGLLENFEVR